MRLFLPLQSIGRALMLPIAVLPVAGLMLRFGQPDLLDLAWLAHAGQIVFSNLPLLFAIGVAVGFAAENNGVAGLAGAIGYLVMTSMLTAFGKDSDMGVLAGIISGVVAGTLYNRFHEIRLPEYLAFFGGKRFVPIVTALACLALGALFGLIWPAVQHAIDATGRWLIGAGAAGVFVFLALNRLLLVAGLHHILNSLVYFVFGSYQSASGAVATGDLNRYFAGDPTAGSFMAGFFPIMMFALPAACLAMYHAAPSARRGRTAGMLLSMALTSFLTGVTEPIEFTFMFLAPVLYLVHAVLCGIAAVVMQALDVRLGYTFSAGAIDYALGYGLASHPLRLWPVGFAFGAVYYGLFRWSIKRFNLGTPGREPQAEARSAVATVPPSNIIEGFIAALGGANNLLVVDACTTRLRLNVIDSAAVSDEELRRLGARGVLRPSSDAVQVVLGPQADIIAGQLRAAVARARAETSRPVSSAFDAAHWFAALGGRENIEALAAVATTRLRVTVREASRVDDRALHALGALAVTAVSAHAVHIITGRETQRFEAALSAALIRVGG